MTKQKQINILEFTKILTIGFTALGLLLGILYSFGGLLIDTLVTLGWIVSNETPGLSYGTVLAFGALIGMPLIGAIFGFLTGLIGSTLYNLTTKILSRK